MLNKKHDNLIDVLHDIRDVLIINSYIFKKGFEQMADDFSALEAAVAEAVAVMNAAVALLSNPATNQAEIDNLTASLKAAADALGAAEPAPAPSDTPPTA
jgi:uncharacterized protein Yka (UPF0111/DUF47 family)